MRSGGDDGLWRRKIGLGDRLILERAFVSSGARREIGGHLYAHMRYKVNLGHCFLFSYP
jgi:hypothetical protein